jgi:uncharacterized membrane protein YeaQ/YmgE (transglycosylase-associated protein family)
MRRRSFPLASFAEPCPSYEIRRSKRLPLKNTVQKRCFIALSLRAPKHPYATGRRSKNETCTWGGNVGAIIGWIIFGVIAGAIAKLLMPGRDPGGFIITMLLGIAGAVVGGFIGRALWGSSGVNDWSIGSFALAIGGAIVLLALYRMIAGRRRTADVVVHDRDRDRWAA